MTPSDQERFKKFIAKFVDDCGFDPPFFLVITSQNKSISARYYSDSGAVEDACSRIVPPGFVAPLVLTMIAPDGTARTAKVEIETAPPTRQ